MLLWAWCNSTKAASADGNDVRQFLETGDLHGEDDVQVDQAGDSLYTGGLALLRWRRYPAQIVNNLHSSPSPLLMVETHCYPSPAIDFIYGGWRARLSVSRLVVIPSFDILLHLKEGDSWCQPALRNCCQGFLLHRVRQPDLSTG